MSDLMSIRAHLEDAQKHLEESIQQHRDMAEGHANHDYATARAALGRSRAAVEKAQRAVDSAFVHTKQAPGHELHDPKVHPAAAMGAQVSSGEHTPRSYTPEEIRQRDQRRAVEHCYNERLRQMGVKR
jgi:hypothetical protein